MDCLLFLFSRWNAVDILRTAINLRGKSVCQRNVYVILIPSKTTISENTIEIKNILYRVTFAMLCTSIMQLPKKNFSVFMCTNVILCYVCVYDGIIVWNLASLNFASLPILCLWGAVRCEVFTKCRIRYIQNSDVDCIWSSNSSNHWLEPTINWIVISIFSEELNI